MSLDYNTAFDKFASDNKLDYTQFNQSINLLTNNEKSSRKYGIFFLLADHDLKGFVTKSDWQDLFSFFNKAQTKEFTTEFLNKFGDSISWRKFSQAAAAVDADLEKSLQTDFSASSFADGLNHAVGTRIQSMFNEAAENGSISSEKFKEMLYTLYALKFDAQYLGEMAQTKKNYSFSDVLQIVQVLDKPIVELADKSSKKSSDYEMFKPIYHFVLGGISGAIGATMVYPIDLIKTRMQAQKTSANMQYKNFFDCLIKIVRQEGLFKLYSGLVPQLVGIVPEKAIKLTMNDLMRKNMTHKDGSITVPGEILSGGCAGASQVIFTNPLEIVKIRLQIQGQMIGKLDKDGNVIVRKSPIQIIRNLGFTGLYKGATACLMRDVPFSAIYFPTYAHLKARFERQNGGEGTELTTAQLLISGAVAGMPAAYLTTPFDVLKTRLQLEQRKGDVSYNGLVDCFKKILKHEGPTAFFKGGLPRVFRSSPQFAFTLASYEILQRFLPFDSLTNKNFGTGSISNESRASVPAHTDFASKSNAIVQAFGKLSPQFASMSPEHVAAFERILKKD